MIRTSGGNRLPARQGLALACLAVALALVALRYARLAFDAIGFPYELDYGEGIVWQQMRMIVAGQGYAPLRPYPAIVFHYPPLYHLVTAGFAALSGIDQLAAGRLVSVLGTLAGAGAIGLCVTSLGRNRQSGWIGGAAAALSVLGTRPVLVWSVVMRVDMLFVALSFAGLWMGLRALERPRWVHGAAVCFVGAIFTKQTAIAAPLAVFAVLLVVRPRVAFAGMATGMAAAVAALVVVSWQTHGEFLHHIVFYNMNRFLPMRGWDIPEIAAKHAALVVVAVAGIGARARAMRAGAQAAGGVVAHWRADARAAGFAMVLVHLALATAMLGLVFKSGSAVNYFLEWIFLLALCAGVALADWWASERAGGTHPLAIALPWLLAMQGFASWTLLESDYPQRAAHAGDYARIAAAVRAAPAPVLSDDMVLLLRGGKAVVMEPSIFAELTAKGVLDPRAVNDRIRAGKFAFVLTEGWPGDPVYDSRYTGATSDAILAAYPQQVRMAGFYVLRFPAGPLPAWAAGLRK